MFLIRRLEVENFKSHRNSKVHLSRGINLIVGRNGAGKTSLLEAILVALYWPEQSIINQYTKNYLTRENTPGYRIKLEFELNGRTYEIFRDSARGYCYLKENGKLLASYDRDSKIARWVRSWLGPPQIFMNAAFIRQGEIDEILKDDDSREKILRKITGIEDIELAIKNLSEVIKCFNSERESLERMISMSADSEERLRSVKDDIKKLEMQISEKESSLENAKRLLSHVEERLKYFDELHKEICEMEGKKIEVEKEKDKTSEIIKTMENSLEAIDKEISSLTMKLSRRSSLKEEIDRYIKLKEIYSKVFPEISQLNVKIAELTSQKNVLSKKISEVEEVEKELEKCRKNLELLEDELKNLKEKEDFWKDIEIKLEKKRECESILAQKNLRIEDVNKLYDGLVQAKIEKENILKEISKFEGKKERLLERKKNLLEAIEKLKQAKERCPVCESKLTKERKERLLKNYEEDIAKIEEEAKQINSDILSLKNSLKSLELLIKKDSEIIMLKNHIETLNSVESFLKGIDLNEIEREKNKAEKIKEEYTKLEGRIAKLEEIVRCQNKDDLLEKISKINEKINSLLARKENLDNLLKQKGFETIDDLKSELEKLEPLYEEWLKLKDVENELEKKKDAKRNIEKKISDLRDDLKRLSDTLKNLENKLNGLYEKYDKDKHESLQKDYVEQSKSVERIRAELEGLKKTLKLLKQEHESLEKQIEKVKKFRRTVKTINTEILPFLEKFKIKLKECKSKVSEYALKTVEFVASKIFEELTDGKYTGIRIKSVENKKGTKVKIFVLYQGNEHEISFLSGGETIALGIAFRLALSLYVAGSLPILILDEPTPFLDEERRRKLIEIMNNYFRRIPQVIVVSHDEELKDAADKIIRVSLQGSSSEVLEE